MVHRIKGDGAQLGRIDLALRVQNPFLGGDIHNLPDQHLRLRIEAHQAAFQRQRQLVDQGRVHKAAPGGVEAGSRHFVRHMVARDNAHIVTGSHVLRVRHTDRKGLAGQNILDRLMARAQTHGHPVHIRDPAPGGVHCVRRPILTVGGDDQHGLGVEDRPCSKILSHIEDPSSLKICFSFKDRGLFETGAWGTALPDGQERRSFASICEIVSIIEASKPRFNVCFSSFRSLNRHIGQCTAILHRSPCSPMPREVPQFRLRENVFWDRSSVGHYGQQR